MKEADDQDAIASRIQLLLERLLGPQVSPAETSEAVEELDALCKKLKFKPAAREWDPFAAILAGRQSSVVPDFESLYREQAKLNSKLSGRYPHDRP